MTIDAASVSPERLRPLRRSEYERLVEVGAFEDERVELLRGVLVATSPQGAAHVTTCRPGERLELSTFPHVAIDLRELLG